MASKLTFALGRDVAGHARATDLSKMPHLLIAGAAGSGKSVMVRALITSLLCTTTPDEVRMILIDTKSDKLSVFNGVATSCGACHCMAGEGQSCPQLGCCRGMESRSNSFAGASAPNIAAFNESRADPAERLPYLVIIIDELADLMTRAGGSVEDPIVRLAQKARATGIHLVLATRPSAIAVTDLMKANFPSRVAFVMESLSTHAGFSTCPARRLCLGAVTCCSNPPICPRPLRLLGIQVTEREIFNICGHWRAEGGLPAMSWA